MSSHSDRGHEEKCHLTGYIRWQDNYIARFLLHDIPAGGKECVCTAERRLLLPFPMLYIHLWARVCVTACKDSIQLACNLRSSMHVHASLLSVCVSSCWREECFSMLISAHTHTLTLITVLLHKARSVHTQCRHLACAALKKWSEWELKIIEAKKRKYKTVFTSHSTFSFYPQFVSY